MKNKSQTDSYFKSILINVKILEQFLFFCNSSLKHYSSQKFVNTTMILNSEVEQECSMWHITHLKRRENKAYFLRTNI